MARYLVIVARTQPALCDYLTRALSGDDAVQVLFDRRQRAQAHAPERRRSAHQPRPVFSDSLGPLGAVVTRTREEVPSDDHRTTAGSLS